MKRVFAPGCALLIDNPVLAESIASYLRDRHGVTERHTVCCHFDPNFGEETKIISICSGCIKRYDTLYKGASAISLWEIIDDDPQFSFPDYAGLKMSVLDACPARKYDKMQKAVRSLLRKMNITVVEPERTMGNGKCCGDSFYGTLPKDEVIGKMRERADEMPAENVAVYCVSCVKAIKNGGKQPNYLPSLLFGAETVTAECDPDLWHSELNVFIENSYK